MARLLALPDKFRGTASASAVAMAMAAGARRHGWEVVVQPLSDGGEGLLEVHAVRGLLPRTSR
ncbi:MAG TPA: glycerate kinase, partial [Acidimicrobiales bacterium]|nr:glycerate kinase [Acidimicrobiales bacterium]